MGGVSILPPLEITMTDNKYKLLPCCHCGGTDLEVIKTKQMDVVSYIVRCKQCQHIGPASINCYGAVDWWNTRDGEVSSSEAKDQKPEAIEEN